MNAKKPNIRYDRRSRVLSIEMKRGKSADSDVQGNVVIDYDRKGSIVRINLYQFNLDAFRRSRRVFRNFAQRSSVAA